MEGGSRQRHMKIGSKYPEEKAILVISVAHAARAAHLAAQKRIFTSLFLWHGAPATRTASALRGRRQRRGAHRRGVGLVKGGASA